MNKKTKNPNRRKEKTSHDPPPHPSPERDAGTVVERAVLGKLSTARLYTLLQLKNIPGRSKLKKKGARIKALAGIVTPADLAIVGVSPDGHPPVPVQEPGTPSTKDPSARPRPRLGERLDAPVVGVDVDAETLVCVLATPGGLETELVVPNTARGARDLANFCRANGATHVAMESTAEYWLTAYWTLAAAGIDVLVANPRQTKATQGRKTDKHDARRIVLARRDGRLKPSVLCTPEQYERRKLSRAAIKKTEQGTRAVARLKGLLHGPSAPKWVTKLHESDRGRQIWTRCLALPEVNVEVVVPVLAEEYARGTHKITDPEELEARARTLVDVLGFLSPNDRIRVVLHMEEYVACKEAAAHLRLQLLKHASQDERFHENLKLLVSIPGVGVDSALTILVEIVDVGNFWDAKALVRWAGLNPKVRQSGHKKRANGRISKMGNKALRWACWNAARIEYAHGGKPGHPFGAFARRLVSESKKPYKVAVTAAARKLLAYVYHVLAQGKPFEILHAESECARVAANRERKLRALKRAIGRAELVEMMPLFVDKLEDANERFTSVMEEYAARVHELLGSYVEVDAGG